MNRYSWIIGTSSRGYSVDFTTTTSTDSLLPGHHQNSEEQQKEKERQVEDKNEHMEHGNERFLLKYATVVETYIL